MANISVISGKNGKITWASKILYLEKWDLEIKIDIEEYQHFGMTADATNLVFKQLVDGFASGTATVSGKFDNTAAAYLPSSKTVYPQVVGTAYFGFNATVGFTCSCMIESIKPSQGVESPFATYEAALKITSCVFTTTG